MSLATVRAAQGAPHDAERLLEECSRAARVGYGADAVLRAPEAVRLAAALERPALAQSLAEPLTQQRPFDDGTIALLKGLLLEEGHPEIAVEHFATAERRWTELGVPYERAHAALARGRCLTRIGQEPEAESALVDARDAFAGLRARPAEQEARAILGDSAT